MVTPARSPQEDTAAAEAINWLVLVQNSRELTSDLRAAFEVWKSTPANAAAFARAQQLTADFRQGSEPEVTRKRKEIHSWVRARRRLRMRLYATGAAACIAGLLAMSADFIHWPLPRLPWKRPVEKVYATAVGQRANVPLSDGSALTLDTDTVVKVIYDGERTIALEKGQALFDVAKGDRRPFVVYAGDRRVVATGTKFDVRLGVAHVEVTLVEGTVAVDRFVPHQTKTHIGPLSVMQPGEKLVARLGELAAIGRVSLDNATAWTVGRHVFKDTPLIEAVADINRYTDTPIVIADSALATLRVNGVFPTGKPEDFARAIGEVNAVAFSIDADGTIRLRSK